MRFIRIIRPYQRTPHCGGHPIKVLKVLKVPKDLKDFFFTHPPDKTQRGGCHHDSPRAGS